MVGLHPSHILVIIIIAVIFFMPQRLPEFTRAIGRMFSEFREGVQGDTQTQAPKDTSRDTK